MRAHRRTGHGSTVVLVGAGAPGYAVFERLVAGARAGGPRRLTIVLVDPYPAGAGRMRRPDQSRLLRMNARAGDVAVAGPDGSGHLGPSVAEWARAVRHGAVPTPPDAVVAKEVLALGPDSFPSRRLQSAYLEWAYQRLLAELPKSVTVHTVADEITGLVDLADGRQGVRLANGPALAADAVVFAQGRPDSPSRGEHGELAAFARARGLTYLPPGSPADRELSGLRPGERVLVRGFGLAFIDLLSLVTEGRGGRFECCDGRLVYRPSGREPLLYVGSRRGVPHHARAGTGVDTVLPAPTAPRFFTAEALAGAVDGAARFTEDAWPLMAKEIGWAYYREYFAAYPDRVALPWDEFEASFARHGWYDARRVELVERAVPQAADRWEFEAVDRPYDWFAAMGEDDVHAAVADHILRDLEACERSTSTAVRRALNGCQTQLLRLAELGLLCDADMADGWWDRFFSLVADGPPRFRLRQLLALADAGVVRFAGPGLRLAADPADGRFRAWSDVTGFRGSAAAAVEAFLPGAEPPGRAQEVAAAALGVLRSRSRSRVVSVSAAA